MQATPPIPPSPGWTVSHAEAPQEVSAGRRREWSRRRWGLLALTVALLAGTAFVIGFVTRDTGPPSASDDRAPVDGFAQRIGFERPSPRLPDRPGPLAATMYDNDFGNGRWLGVTSRGQLWELPAGANVLSPDGRLLLTGQRSGHLSRLMVHDLSTGNLRVFDDIEQPFYGGGRAVRYRLDPNGVAHWAPDGSAVLAGFAERGQGARAHPRVLDVASGVLAEVVDGEPAGFRTPSQAITVHKVGGGNAEGGIVATTTDLRTGTSAACPCG